MKTKGIFMAFFLCTFFVTAQDRQIEKTIVKGINRFYSFNIKTDKKLYFLNNARYNEYTRVFTGTIAKVDSSYNVENYILKRKEMQLIVAPFEITSVFLSIDLKDIKEVKTMENSF